MRVKNRRRELDETLQIVVCKTCLRCGKEFSVKKRHPSSWTRSYCGSSCAAITRLEQQQLNIWTEPELELLKSWIGKKPLAQIQREWKPIAKKRGWSDRSDDAIHVKFARLCRLLEGSEKPKTDNLTMCQWAQNLGIPVDRIRAWRRYGLFAKEYSCDADGRPHIIAISRKDLRAFAERHPEQFWGIEQVKLSKALGDAPLARAIAQTVEQPTTGRSITVIRLDTGDVYPSARDAAARLNLNKSVVLRVSLRDTPMRSGMDFARLDYPVYWVPLAIREEFNSVAGGVFYELYLQLKDLDGYSKTSCCIVAGRMAVQITQFTFKRNLKETNKGIELTPKQILIDFWTNRFISNLKLFLHLDQQQGWHKIMSTIKNWAYREFYKVFPTSNRQLTSHLEEYALWYIQYLTEGFFKRNYLPKNYKPQNKLEMADFYTYIYGSILALVEIRPDLIVRLVHVLTWKYKRKMGLYHERAADLSGTQLDDEVSDFSFQRYALKFAATQTDDKNEYAQLLEDLLEFIKHQPITNEYRERIQLYIAMKLEEASNKEIATTMGVSEGEVRSIEVKLKELAVKFQEAG